MNGLSLERARAAKRQLAERFDALPQLRGIGVAVLDVGYGVKLNLSERPGDRGSSRAVQLCGECQRPGLDLGFR